MAAEGEQWFDYNIMNGPGKWDLAGAMFEPGKSITFTISSTIDPHREKKTVKVVITGVEIQSYPDDRTNFAIKGYSDDPPLVDGGCPGTRAYLEGDYNLTERFGRLRVKARAIK